MMMFSDTGESKTANHKQTIDENTKQQQQISSAKSTSGSMSEAPDHQQPASSKTATPGEELWRVHLNRYSQQLISEDDLDHDAASAFHHKPPSDRSIGEELWLVHCKRARDRAEEEEGEKKGVAKPEPVKNHRQGSGGDAPKVIHLRNRDVKIIQ